jgi:hypothetical protein
VVNIIVGENVEPNRLVVLGVKWKGKKIYQTTKPL